MQRDVAEVLASIAAIGDRRSASATAFRDALRAANQGASARERVSATTIQAFGGSAEAWVAMASLCPRFRASAELLGTFDRLRRRWDQSRRSLRQRATKRRRLCRVSRCFRAAPIGRRVGYSCRACIVRPDRRRWSSLWLWTSSQRRQHPPCELLSPRRSMSPQWPPHSRKACNRARGCGDGRGGAPEADRVCASGMPSNPLCDSGSHVTHRPPFMVSMAHPQAFTSSARQSRVCR